jgi:hypothetical protein
MGTKVSYAEIQNWLRKSIPEIPFFTLKLDRVARCDRLTVLLPRARNMGPSQRDEVVLALHRHPGLEFLLDHRVLTIRGELVHPEHFTGRKLVKVTDLRSASTRRVGLSRTLR